MAARIRSLRNGIAPIDEASRDDLVAGDVVSLQSIDAATTYAWTIVFAPQDLAGNPSAATFSGNPATVSPGSFTVDNEGAYLIRLVVDAGLATEDTQYVRLRALTSSLGLELVSAGERRDSSGVIPVDVDVEGWANEQNLNLQKLEAALVGGVGVWNTVSVAGPTHTAANTEFVIITAATTEITLPAPSANDRIAFKLAVAPVDVQVKTHAGGVTIDGTDYSAVGLPLTFQWEQFNVISDGTDWFIW